MNERDTMILTNYDGTKEEVELILYITKGTKNYILYKNKNKEMYASYITENNILHNDLTDEEYDMIEDIYFEGIQ